jgi:hypothetical protein
MQRLSLFIFALIFGLMGCNKGSDPSPADSIRKTWKVATASQTAAGQTTQLYTEGGSNNLQDFSKFRLQFTDNTNYSYTDYVSGNASVGTWAFDNAGSPTKVNFSSGPLNGISADIASPTKTNLTDLNLNISYTEQSPKVGARTLSLQLVPGQ